MPASESCLDHTHSDLFLAWPVPSQSHRAPRHLKAPLEFSLSTFARTGPLPVVSKSFLSSYILLALASALGRFSGLSSRLLSPAGPTPREFTVHLGPRPSTSTRIVSGINRFTCIMSKILLIYCLHLCAAILSLRQSPQTENKTLYLHNKQNLAN